MTAPAAVMDLAIGKILASEMTLLWSATGDDGLSGLANRYEIRYSTAPLNDTNFAGATLVTQSLVPRDPGVHGIIERRGTEHRYDVLLCPESLRRGRQQLYPVQRCVGEGLRCW